ncbi:MAG: hypothetical protein N3A54_01065 [Patescibacteria group bacterium]|nr:hypothetical protein [Patescibacteria group bacterium]
MSSLLQFAAGLTKRQQVFTSSGTFTPSARLLALGGWVEVTCVGGGGGGYIGGDIRAGGSGGHVVRRIVQVTGPVTVTVGAGGAGGSSPQQGGNSSFGTLVSAMGGLTGNQWVGGAPDWYSWAVAWGGSSMHQSSGSFAWWHSNANPGMGGTGIDGYGNGGFGTGNTIQYGLPTINGAANTGNGGCAGGSGGSGIVIVEWWE